MIKKKQVLETLLPFLSSAEEQQRASVRDFFCGLIHCDNDAATAGLLMFLGKMQQSLLETKDPEQSLILKLAICCASEELVRQTRELDSPADDAKSLGEKMSAFLLNTKGESGRSIASELAEADEMFFLQFENNEDQENQS